jgi:hypothetical protein
LLALSAIMLFYWRHVMIVGIVGLIGSGKDTIANHLVSSHGFRRMSYAASLKDAVSAIFGWDRVMLDGVTQESRQWREQVDQWWAKRLEIPNLTPRFVLQHLGTEVFRNNFANDIWVASLEHRLLSSNDHVVITDCRFKNEIESIRSIGGIVIQVKRGQDPSWYQSAESFNQGPRNMTWAISRQVLLEHQVHASEYSHVGLEVDYTFSNNGTIQEIENQVTDMILDIQRVQHRAAA